MIRHLIPRFEYGKWTGAALTINPVGGHELPDGFTREMRIALNQPTTLPMHDDVHGRILCIQWLGLMVELGVGRVR